MTCADVANRSGVDLADAVMDRWADVRQRNWIADPLRGGQSG